MSFRRFRLKKFRKKILFQLIFIIIISWTFFKTMILHAYNLTINAIVPSGDDIYVHAYYSLKVIHDSYSPFHYRILNETIIPTQYPNIIHYILSPLYLFTLDPLFLIKGYSVLEFATMIIGAILYTLLINYILAKKTLQTIILSSLIPLFSYWMLQTLAAGSVMYLLDVLVLLPLTALLLVSKKFLFAGLTFGLSCLNWLGFLIIGLLIFTWFLTELLSVLMSKNTKNAKLIFNSFVQLFLGLSIGGNAFIIRFMAHFLEAFPDVLFESSTLSVKAPAYHFRPALTFDKFSSYLYIKNDYFLFVIISLAFVVILISSLIRKLKSSSDKIMVWLNIFWIVLLITNILLINLRVPNVFEIQIRCLRTLSLLTVIPIVSFISIITYVCRVQTFSARFSCLKMGRYKHLLQESLCDLLIALIVIMLMSSQFFNFFTKLEKGPDGLFRANEEELREILLFRERFVKMNENIMILGIKQVGSFLPPLLSIPSKNITVFLLTPPALLMRLDPEDPERKFSEILVEGLLINESQILSSYNVKYLVLNSPKEKQFYWEEVLKFNKELWDMDFSALGEVIYETDKLKIWEFKTS